MPSNSFILRQDFEKIHLDAGVSVGNGVLAVDEVNRNYKNPETQLAWTWFQRGWASRSLRELHRMEPAFSDRRHQSPPEPKV